MCLLGGVFADFLLQPFHGTLMTFLCGVGLHGVGFVQTGYFNPYVVFHALKGYKDYKDGRQPESLADGNWLVKQNQPVSKTETKSDTNLRSLYESGFRNALISKSVIL